MRTQSLKTLALASLLIGLQSSAQASNLECGTGEGLSIAQRIKDCGEISKKLSTGQTFTLVARNRNEDRAHSEYFRDDITGLVWGPTASKFYHWEEAIRYCASLNDLGLSWHLPTRAEFLKAGNKDNEDKKYGRNKVLLEAMDLGLEWLWTSTSVYEHVFDARGYFGQGFRAGFAEPIEPDYASSVRCVGR